MKYVSLLLLTLMVMWCGDAQARDMREMAHMIKQPMEIKGGTSERMNVMFPHGAHRATNCMQCHHEVGPEGRYVACTQCHSKPGPRERDPMSMFMAFHAKEDTRSCVGCHKKTMEKNQDNYGARFKGCRPCHMTSGARQALNAVVPGK